ncbi:E3 ubiquitin-protein ligase [Armadillidium nasatum]|uniref:E3 ubiquitin-protein ligase RNF170 n=1 Tax=Armadillidium nasatum TaxID=96803 RepID=A0A5N5TJK3_9CRUS|nr:E3 ubiquitin-protein ligase [Armadillidium nasatum]
MVRTRIDNAQDCPICFDNLNFAVETNCGHLFCGNCFFEYVNRNIPPVSCPICRQSVTVILECFTRAESETTSGTDQQTADSIKSNCLAYNARYSNHPRSIWGQLRDLPTILRHVWAELFTWRGLGVLYRMRIILCFVVAFIYAVVPFDIVPEAFFGFLGLLDDLFITLFLLLQVATFYRNHVGVNR